MKRNLKKLFSLWECRILSEMGFAQPLSNLGNQTSAWSSPFEIMTRKDVELDADDDDLGTQGYWQMGLSQLQPVGKDKVERSWELNTKNNPNSKVNKK